MVRVRAAGVNFGDIMARSFRSVTPRGFNMPFLFWLPAKLAIGWSKPRVRVLGNEFAGDVVVAGDQQHGDTEVVEQKFECSIGSRVVLHEVTRHGDEIGRQVAATCVG